jgi:C1A family cysteine protease
MTENNTKKHTYGWRPDRPDQRDFLYGTIRKPLVEKLPFSVDLRKFCSKVEDQGQLGSCTSQSLVGALEFIEIKDKVPNYRDLSRLFVYYEERIIENTVSSDSGAELRDGIKALNKKGVCGESLWPYVVGKFRNKPTQNCYTDAKKHVITSYYRLNTLDEMRVCLASGFPFVFGFSVYSSFESDEVAKTGIVPMPDKNEELLGGHAVMSVGYNDNTQKFIVRNSWGENWGDHGYCYMPYKYLENRNLSDDFWCIKRGENL